MIHKVCRVYSTPFDYEDLYQEILISIWRSLKNFKSESMLSTWIYKVVLNTCLTYRRNQNRNPQYHSLEVVKEHLNIKMFSSEEGKVNILYASLKKLSKDDRSLIFLYLEGKKYEEISEITGISNSNVGVKINRIKKKLQEIYKNQQYGKT